MNDAGADDIFITGKSIEEILEEVPPGGDATNERSNKSDATTPFEPKASSSSGAGPAEFTPLEMRERPQWVNWKVEVRDGVNTKPPINPQTGEYADTTDSRTWTSFDVAVRSATSRKMDGIGFVFTKDAGILGVDLDHCRNPLTGEIAPWAQEIVAALESYTEISPSKDGLHILIRAAIPPNGRHQKAMPGGAKLELYDEKRYFTVTGAHLSGTPTAIQARQSHFDGIYSKLFPPKTNGNGSRPRPSALSLSDRELIDMAVKAKNGAKFKRIWEGDISDYDNDESRADEALCYLLAFWTNKDATRIDALFRQSGLNREKWEKRQDYRDRTITNAINNCRETFNSHNAKYSQHDEERRERPLPEGEQRRQANANESAELEDVSPSSKFDWQLYDLGDVDEWNVEALAWKIEGLIPAGSVGFLSGAPKDGKSLFSLDQIVHIAHGRPWLERFNTSASQILYIAREDPARRLKDRITEINSGYGYGPIPRGRVQFLIRERLNLTEEKHIDWLYEQTRRHDFDFIVLDVLNRMIPELDEMSAKDMAKMVSLLEKINRELNMTIKCIDHTRKPPIGKGSGREEQMPNPFDLKGSIAKYGCADFMLCVSRTRQAGRLQFYAENKDTDNHPQFFIDVSAKGSGQPKFRYAGEVEKLASDMKAIGDANRNRVLSAFKDPEERLSSSVIAGRVGLSDATARRHLSDLFKKDKLDAIGEGKARRYWLRSAQAAH